MNLRMTILAGAVFCAAWSAVAENPPAASPRDVALTSLAAKEAEAALLRGQIVEWESVLAEANQARERYETFLRGARDAAEKSNTPSTVRPGPLAAEANQAIGRGDVAWSQIQRIKKRVAELEPQITAAKAQLDRFNRPATAGTSPFSASADSRANEPPGGVKLTSGPGYVPAPQAGEKPGLATGLPNWINTNPQSAGNSQTPPSGAYPPGVPGGPMVGIDMNLPPAGSSLTPWTSWPPYLSPWPAGSGGSPGHSHTPSKSGGHKHGAGGKDIR